MLMRFHFLVSAVVVVATWAAAQAPAPTTKTSQSTESAIDEAVVRYQIKSWDIGADSFCIRIKGQDADDKFLRQLKPLPVKPASDCLQKKTKDGMSVVDKHSKKKSVLLGVGNIVGLTDNEAKVEGSYLCGNQCMSGGVYHLSWDGSQWQVTKYDAYISE